MIIEHRKWKELKISNSKEIYSILCGLWADVRGFDRDKEHLYVIGLTRRNHIRYIDLVSFGSISGTIAHPREIYRVAIHKAVAGGIVLAHNHPSGNLTPSEHDNELTQRIKAAGKILDIPLIDHVIFTDDGYYSYADEGAI
jgi:DNA repair protein RadC